MNERPTEWAVRVWRDTCFGDFISDHSWECVRKTWCEPENVDWLLRHQRKLDYPTPPKAKAK